MLTIKSNKNPIKLSLIALSVLSISGVSIAAKRPQTPQQATAQAPAPEQAAAQAEQAIEPAGPATAEAPEQDTKVYVGVNLGGGWQSNSGTVVPGVDPSGLPPEAIAGIGQISPANDVTTFAGEIRGGISFDTPYVSIGAEVAGLFPTNTTTHDQVITNGGLTLLSSDNAQLTELGAIRGFINLKATPGVTVGITGGPAIGWGTFTSVQTFSSGGQFLHTNTTTVDDHSWGGTFGGSIGYNVNDSWTAVLAYDHYWFANRTGSSNAFDSAGAPVPGTNITTNFKPQFGFASVGLVYKWPVGKHSAPRPHDVYK